MSVYAKGFLRVFFNELLKIITIIFNVAAVCCKGGGNNMFWFLLFLIGIPVVLVLMFALGIVSWIVGFVGKTALRVTGFALTVVLIPVILIVLLLAGLGGCLF